MSRPAWFRVYALAAIAVAAAVSVVWPSLDPLYVFALLITVAGQLRLDDESSNAGYEAAVVFAGVVLLHTPLVALLAILTFRPLLTLSYTAVALLYCSAVAADAPVTARVSGYVLLVVGSLAVNLALRAARRRELPENLVAQVKLLL